MNVRRVRVLVASAVAVVTLTTPGRASSQSSTVNELVWTWFASCRDARTMTVVVSLNNKRLFASSFPICAIFLADKPRERPHENLRFVFKAPAKMFGDEFARLGAPDIEGNIWETGSEHDMILLGVSFMMKDRILLNTIYIGPGTRRRKPNWQDTWSYSR
jgi:hypothetical protein